MIQGNMPESIMARDSDFGDGKSRKHVGMRKLLSSLGYCNYEFTCMGTVGVGIITRVRDCNCSTEQTRTKSVLTLKLASKIKPKINQAQKIKSSMSQRLP